MQLHLFYAITASISKLIIISLITVCISLIFFSSAARAQHINAEPVKCEEAVHFLSDALLQDLERKNKEARLIILFRSGDGETSRISKIRSKSTNAFIKGLKPHVEPVYGNGDRIKGYGVVEIFVEGVLLYKLPVSKNKDIDLLSCSP